MPCFVDPNIVPVTDHAKEVVASRIEAIRAAAYTKPDVAIRAEQLAPGQLEAVAHSIIANAALAQLAPYSDSTVICPVGRRAYEKAKRYRPWYWQRGEFVSRCLKALGALGLIEVTPGQQSKPAKLGDARLPGVATSYTLTEAGKAALRGVEESDYAPLPTAEVVMLKARGSDEELPERASERDNPEALVDYPDTPETNSMRAFVRRLNDHMVSHRVTCDATIGGRRLRHSSVYLRRVFNRGSFACGGRFFGHWAQGAPKAARASMKIDGQPVVEVDFSAMFLSLLYHTNGLDFDIETAYDFGPRWAGVSRAAMKRAVLAFIMRNRRGGSFPKTVRSEVKDGEPVLYFPTHVSWSEVEAAILEKHAAVVPFMFKDEDRNNLLGMRLMRVESNVLASAMGYLVARDIGFVPLHDGLLVPRGRANEVRDAMLRAYTAIVGKAPVVNIKEPT
jgi:hypothetical protein